MTAELAVQAKVAADHVAQSGVDTSVVGVVEGDWLSEEAAAGPFDIGYDYTCVPLFSLVTVDFSRSLCSRYASLWVVSTRAVCGPASLPSCRWLSRSKGGGMCQMSPQLQDVRHTLAAAGQGLALVGPAQAAAR